jgi:hypothetical protein
LKLSFFRPDGRNESLLQRLVRLHLELAEERADFGARDEGGPTNPERESGKN